jgi:hypothetical protein
VSEEVAPRTVVDSATQTIRCERCGEEVPIPLGVVRWVTGVLEAFDAAHTGCRRGEDGTRTYFSEPRKGEG